MALIEEIDELIDTFPHQPTNNTSTQNTTTTTTTTTPGPAPLPGAALPAHIAQIRNSSVDEVLKEMERMPFFMRNLPGSSDDTDDNPELEALKALAYEGEPHEIATNFKEQGNDCFKVKRYRDAIEFYTKALAVKCGVGAIEEACYANRAACNLELKNYRKVLIDCAQAMTINHKNVKAYYRSSLALVALLRLDEAMDCILKGLEVDSSNKALVALQEKVKGQIKAQDEKERKRKAEGDHKKKVQLMLKLALNTRGISTRTTPSPPPELPEDTHIRLENELEATSTLLFPTIFLYPLDAQSDFITSFPENSTLSEQLSVILDPADPPPWDSGKEYVPSSRVDCYMETVTGGLIKVGKKVPLRDVLGGPGKGKVEIVDGVVRIIVVPRLKSEQWIKDWKKRKEGVFSKS